jgi:hypothetical protein
MFSYGDSVRNNLRPARISPLRHAFAAAAGLTLSAVVYQIWNLPPRYAFAAVAGLFLLAAGLALVRHLPTLLIFALAFELPFTGLEKTFFLQPITTYVVAGVSIGLLELTLGALYAIWLARVLVLRNTPVPKLTRLDMWVFVFWLAHAVSILSALSGILVLFEVVRLGKYALAFFYLEHNVEKRHLKGIVAGVLFAIALQTAVALIQYRTGQLLGVGQTKGASEKTYDQYVVTGFENVRRAEGTTFDSHALGLFMAMSLPVAFATAATRGVSRWHRAICAAIGGIGLIGLTVSFARAGWVGFLGALGVLAVVLIRGQWRGYGKRLAASGIVMFAILSLLATPLIPQVRRRIVEAPPELVSARVETVQMGLSMWKANPWTGLGANNYMRALEVNFSIFEGDPYFIPAHNMPTMILIELGVLGLIVFVGMCISFWRSGWRASKTSARLEQSLAGAFLGGLVAWQIEGIFDPIYITNVTYFLLWFQLGMIAALARLARARS